jgi:hypothetical protein
MDTTYKFATLIAGIVAGINKRLAGKTLHLLDHDFTDKELVAVFQPVLDTAAAEKEADAKRTAAITKARDARVAATPFLRALKPMLQSMYGSNAEALADFGLHEPKRRTAPPAVKAEAAKKAVATRKALGTKGKRQRADAKKQLAKQAAAGHAAASPAAAAALPAPATPPAAGPAAPQKS